MKKFFSRLGMASLICLSFIVSEKTATVVKDMDSLMTEIKEVEENYYIDAMDAIITDNLIVPGLNGRKVNVKKSYKEMKKIGSFNENYLVYDDVKPSIKLKGNYDKIVVGGNKKKNMVSLIFTVYDNDDISEILKILDKTDTKATFFIDGNWLEDNNDGVMDLLERGHTIGNLGYNKKYEETGFVWMNNILKTVLKQKINYCYDTGLDENLNACSLQKNYTIRPDIIVSSNPLIEIKKQIKAGSLISLNINDKTRQELELVIDYIKSRGYKLENLTNHLSEENNN